MARIEKGVIVCSPTEKLIQLATEIGDSMYSNDHPGAPEGAIGKGSFAVVSQIINCWIMPPNGERGGQNDFVEVDGDEEKDGPWVQGIRR